MDRNQVFSIVRQAVAEDVSVVSTVIEAIMTGQTEAMGKLKEELSWSNMAMDMALMMALGHRITPGTKKMAEHVIRQRLMRFNGSGNGIERQFLENTEASE